MTNFFEINSVAIVWASETEWKLSNDMLKYLSDFKWNKYWVNPKGGSFNSIMFYDSISSLPEIVDILVFVIPAVFIPKSLIEAWKKWIRRAIIISAWFKEVGNFELENEIKAIAKQYDIMILWPNCLWYVDVYRDLNLSFWTKKINKWNVSIVSQSGAMAVAISDWALEHNIWFSRIISLGNKAWMDEVDYLHELASDNNTEVIAMYLESLERWKNFLKVAKEISKTKPVIILKSWISEIWQKAASSHTWALWTSADIMFEAFAEANIHFTNDLNTFFVYIEIFSRINFRDIPEELVIITNAWWPWVISTDYTEKYWVVLSKFNEAEKNNLKEAFGDSLVINNPIDIIGDATSKTYSQILTNLNKLSVKKAVLILLTAQSVTDVENIADIISSFKKDYPVLLTSFIWWEWVKKWKEILGYNWILNYEDPAWAIDWFSKLLKQKHWSNEKEEEIKNISFAQIDINFWNEKGLLSQNAVREIFKVYEINYVQEILVNDKSGIESAFKELNSDKIVAKVSSSQIAHKFDIWAVILNIETLDEAVVAFDTIKENVLKNVPEAKIDWILYARMLSWWENRREVFLWFKRDASFWDVMYVWMWWTYVNVFEDIKIAVWLVSRDKIYRMIKKLKFFPILEWIRGQKSINFESLIDQIYRIQFIFHNIKQIKEIDINPIICDEKEAIIVDAKFYL